MIYSFPCCFVLQSYQHCANSNMLFSLLFKSEVLKFRCNYFLGTHFCMPFPKHFVCSRVTSAISMFAWIYLFISYMRPSGKIELNLPIYIARYSEKYFNKSSTVLCDLNCAQWLAVNRAWTNIMSMNIRRFVQGYGTRGGNSQSPVMSTGIK